MRSAIIASFHLSMVLLSLGLIGYFYLLKQSRWVPGLLGGFNVLAAVLALLFALALMFVPDSAARLRMAGWLPIFLAEIATGLWLLLARQSPARHQADA